MVADLYMDVHLSATKENHQKPNETKPKKQKKSADEALEVEAQ